MMAERLPHAVEMTAKRRGGLNDANEFEVGGAGRCRQVIKHERHPSFNAPPHHELQSGGREYEKCREEITFAPCYMDVLRTCVPYRISDQRKKNSLTRKDNRSRQLISRRGRRRRQNQYR